MDSTEEKSSSFSFRSSNFSPEEINKLIDLVDEHKIILQNKSTSTSANNAKEITWGKVEREYNKHGFATKRSADILKTKWSNLKRNVKGCKGNVNLSNEMKRVFDIIRETKNINENNVNNIVDAEDESSKHNSLWNDSLDKQLDGSNDAVTSDKIVRTSRSLNFSPNECKLLLKLIRQEKKCLFARGNDNNTMDLKKRAWNRVTMAFNNENPVKRPTKVLQSKFHNMKKFVRRASFRDVGMKHEKFYDENTKETQDTSNTSVKSEQLYTERISVDDFHDDGFNDLHSNVDDNNDSQSADPLRLVLTDSALPQIEDKEVVKLKVELLKYKIENAKLERQRLMNLINAEATDRETKAIETSLRLRTARLEMLTAEMKLPETVPIPDYTSREQLAKQYLETMP